MSHHGRETLVARYGKANLARLFRSVLVSHGVRTPAGWDTENFGAGIADAAALLKAPLPAALPAAGELKKAMPAAKAARYLREITRMFPDAGPAEVRQGLTALLRTSDAELDRGLDEVGRELTMQLAVGPELRDRLRVLVGRPRAGRTGSVKSTTVRTMSKHLAGLVGG